MAVECKFDQDHGTTCWFPACVTSVRVSEDSIMFTAEAFDIREGPQVYKRHYQVSVVFRCHHRQACARSGVTP